MWEISQCSYCGLWYCHLIYLVNTKFGKRNVGRYRNFPCLGTNKCRHVTNQWLAENSHPLLIHALSKVIFRGKAHISAHVFYISYQSIEVSWNKWRSGNIMCKKLYDTKIFFVHFCVAKPHIKEWSLWIMILHQLFRFYPDLVDIIGWNPIYTKIIVKNQCVGYLHLKLDLYEWVQEKHVKLGIHSTTSF